MQELTTPGQFRSFVRALLEEHKPDYRRSLEEYLRSLWVVIGRSQHQPVSHTLLGHMLAEAFVTEPAAFDPAWLQYEQPLDWSYEDGRYVLTTFVGEERIIEDHVDEFRLLTHTILFQIADLRRMRGNQLEDKNRSMGLVSPTGNDWYNFDVFTYLRCSTNGMFASGGDAPFEGCDWVELAAILELGRIYE
jgi:hypothetical protein